MSSHLSDTFRRPTCLGRSIASSICQRFGATWRHFTALLAGLRLIPNLLVRMLLVGYCYGIRSERRLCEEVHLKLFGRISSRNSGQRGSPETLWQDIVKKLGPDAIPTPGHLIDLVVERRILANDLERIAVELPNEESKRRARIKRDFRDRKYDEVGHRSVSLHNLLEGRKRVLGRQEGGFRRKFFCVGWSDKFQELCGSPLDEVVATITRIAFGEHGVAAHADSKKHDILQEVRDARRRAWGTKDTRQQK
jgi:hypothetical protein